MNFDEYVEETGTQITETFQGAFEVHSDQPATPPEQGDSSIIADHDQ